MAARRPAAACGRLARGAARGRRSRPGDRAGRARTEPADPGDPPDPRRGQDAAEAAAARRVGADARRVDRRRGGVAATETARRRPSGDAAPRHWAFEPVKAVAPPPDPTGWSDRPIDRFVAARRRAAGLAPVRRADRRTLIRRVTFDLIGLPPDARGGRRVPRRSTARTPSPGSSTDCSPRRTTASAGDATGWTSPATPTPPATTPTIPIPEAVRYRDYVIDAFNRDKPYDRFVREQLAGDILAREETARRLRRVGRRHRVPRPVAALRDRPVRALASDARRHDRHDRPRLPRADAPLRPLPRPQVRPGHASATITPSTGSSPARRFPYAGSEETAVEGVSRG